MKKRFAVLLALLLLGVTAVPAFAAAPYDADWVPPVPDFIISEKNGFSFSPDVGMSMGNYDSNTALKKFLTDHQNFPGIVLLDQGVYNRYKEEKGEDYDRQFSVYIVAPDKKANGSYYNFGFFQHHGGPQHIDHMAVPSPMAYYCGDNPHTFIKYIYDERANQLVLQPGVSKLPGGSGSMIRFTYVLAFGTFYSEEGDGSWAISVTNGPFSEPSDVYPGFTRVSGRDFGVGTIYHQVVDGKVVNHWRDYDWWLGVDGGEIPPYNQNLDLDQDTDGDGKPDLNVDTDGDGKPDINIDTNGDGKPDLNIDTNGDGKPDINIDTDRDGKPDLNIDTNGDKKPDLNVDTNGDFAPDINIDTNGDGKPDINIDTNGDKKPDLNIDTDGDRKPDLNIDTTGDGKPDTNVDIDGDGKPDVNVKPGGGSGGGGSGSGSSGSGSESGSGSGSSGSGGGSSESGSGDSGGGGSGGGSSSDKGSGHPDAWFNDSDDDLTYDPWQFFDPFQAEKEPITWDKDYDPTKPGDQIYNGYDPFAVFNNLLKEMFGG